MRQNLPEALVRWGRSWRALTFEKRVELFFAPIVTGLVIAGLSYWLFHDQAESEMAPGDPDSPQIGQQVERQSPRSEHFGLELIDVAVIEDATTDLILKDEFFPDRREVREVAATAIDIVVRNTAPTTSVIHRADFRIRARYPLCATEGGPISITAKYDVELPRNVAVGEEVSVDLRQEVRSNRTDRFLLNIGLVTKDRGSTGPSSLFQLDVHLHHDRGKSPLKAGTVVVAVPFPDQGYFDPEVNACAQHNLETLRAAASLDGERSAELTDLTKRTITP